MDLILTRTDERPDGIYGLLTDMNDVLVAHTLEHAYEHLAQYGPYYAAKLPSGIYSCVRGLHRLHNGPQFDTFEVTGVAGHSGILFHVGNYNKDSDGCVLVGSRITKNGDDWAVTQSRVAFNKFMELQKGVDVFTLTVKDA